MRRIMFWEGLAFSQTKNLYKGDITMKKLLSVLLVFAVLFGLGVTVTAQSETEIPEGYTPVYTAEDLNNIRNNLSGKYILMNDIDLSVYENWEPIGTQEAPFTGELDGSDNIISNLTINKEYNENDTMYWGLFGYIKGGADLSPSVKSIRIVKVSVAIEYEGEGGSELYCGVISGYCDTALIENCAISGGIKIAGFSNIYFGGIAGEIYYGEATRCVNHADIHIALNRESKKINVGGVTGSLPQSEISESCNFGNIYSEGTDVRGNCVAKIGGVVGNGTESKNITDCFNRGDITVDFSSDRTYIGGISGEAYKSSCLYNIGEISCCDGFYGYVGAILGTLFSNPLAVGEPAEISCSYYNNIIQPVENGNNRYDYLTEDTKYNINCLSEDKFRNQESFIGFDFEAVWSMEENGYPVLQNQPMINVKEEISLEVGETFDVDLTDCEWSIEDENIVNVDENNNIIALSAGETVVTVEIEYGYSYEYTVTVSDPNPPVEEPTDPNPPAEEPDKPDTPDEPDKPDNSQECYLIKVIRQLWSSFKWAVIAIFDTIFRLF